MSENILFCLIVKLSNRIIHCHIVLYFLPKEQLLLLTKYNIKCFVSHQNGAKIHSLVPTHLHYPDTNLYKSLADFNFFSLSRRTGPLVNSPTTFKSSATLVIKRNTGLSYQCYLWLQLPEDIMVWSSMPVDTCSLSTADNVYFIANTQCLVAVVSYFIQTAPIETVS